MFACRQSFRNRVRSFQVDDLRNRRIRANGLVRCRTTLLPLYRASSPVLRRRCWSKQLRKYDFRCTQTMSVHRAYCLRLTKWLDCGNNSRGRIFRRHPTSSRCETSRVLPSLSWRRNMVMTSARPSGTTNLT